MPRNLRLLAIPALLFSVAIAVPAHAEISCSDHRIAASAIRTTSDIEAFVRCAYEFVQEVGTAEAHRAFHEDERWRQGPYYVFVDGIAESGEDSVAYVYPPNPSQEGLTWGPLVDDYGTDLVGEFNRLLKISPSGWTYYRFLNPATGAAEPKAAYVTEIDWNGNQASIGAGIYLRDVPGTCHEDDVNAAALDAEPSDDRLREFVRCAALLVESQGYFAMAELEGSARWTHGSTYAFVMDMMGNQVLSGNKIRVNGNRLHEWGGKSMPTDQFGGRDIVGVGDTFGEAPIFYRAINPMTGARQGKVGLLKRVVAQGVPLLVGAGYYVSPDRPVAATSCSDNYVTAGAIRTRRDMEAFVECAAEYVMENGTAEALRAFNEDARWRQGPYYIFVDGLAGDWSESIVHGFPPDPSREGHPWGSLVDNFGTDYYFELYRVMSVVDAGWLHYSFTNFASGREEPKSSYVKTIDWDGEPAAVGAGIYRRDLPGTCNSAEVNAAALDADPTDENLKEFVRCAAMTMESMGFFAGPVLERDSRWNSGSTYVFVLDPETGVREFSSNDGRSTGSAMIPERLFEGRDLLDVATTFGEAYWYYNKTNPVSGATAAKVSYLKRVVAQGVPLLVGSGIYTAGPE